MRSNNFEPKNLKVLEILPHTNTDIKRNIN